MSKQSDKWEESFTRWWIRYLRDRYHVGPEMRYKSPYIEMERAAIDASRRILLQAAKARRSLE